MTSSEELKLYKHNSYSALTCMRDSGTEMTVPPKGDSGNKCVSMRQTIKKLRRSLRALSNGNINRSENIQK